MKAEVTLRSLYSALWGLSGRFWAQKLPYSVSITLLLMAESLIFLNRNERYIFSLLSLPPST